MPLPPYWHNVEPAIYMQVARHNSSIVGALACAGADNAQCFSFHFCIGIEKLMQMGMSI